MEDRSRSLGRYSQVVQSALPSEEVGNLLVSFGGGGGGGCGAEFHDGNIAFEPEFWGSGTVFGFAEDGFSYVVPVGCKHRTSLSVLNSDFVP